MASGLLAIGPRLLLNLDDVPATNLLQPGNRAAWRLLVADTAGRGALDPYLGWLQAELKPGQRMENVRDLRPEVRQTLERAEKFLGLSALVAVILAAVAVALAASRYLRRHLDTAAMLRCFGASRSRTLALFVLQFGALGLAASAAGIAVALGGPAAAGAAAGVDHRDRTAGARTAAGDRRVRHRRAAAVRLRAAAAASRSRACPPLRVLRRDLPRPRAGGVVAYLLGAAVIAFLIGWQAQDAKAARIMVGGIGALLALAALVAWLLHRRAEAAAAARRDVALRAREPAPPPARVEPADRRARRSG